MIEYKKLRTYAQEVVKKSAEKACEINVNKMYTAVPERQLSFLESELGSGSRLGPLEDMFVFTIFLFQDFNKRHVTKLGHRTDTRQVCFSLKSKVYTLSAAKCVSLSLQVIAP